MKPNPLSLPVGRLTLRLADGTTIEREWTIATLEGAPLGLRPGTGESPLPTWIKNPSKRWDHPQDPILYSGDVEPGHEDEARAWAGPS